MRIINNENKYLSPSIVESCFEYDRHLKVDKVATGNGFSTSFLKLNPPIGKVNIMIAPNKAVIMDKQNQYLSGQIDTVNKIGFFYKEGTSIISEHYNLLIFVVDSFFLYSESLHKIRHKINYILVDEAHSIEIQSSFRFSLKDFDYKISKYLRDSTAIVSVTASPNLFTEIDIKINNRFITPQTIFYTKSRPSSILRAKQDLSNGKTVVIATNSPSVIVDFANERGILKANYIVGESLLRSLAYRVKILKDPESRLIFLSSRGFEGYDIYAEDASVYFFEDRAKEHESFYISNLYQAINRVRNGATYTEYSCRYRNEPRGYFDETKIDLFISDPTKSPESKQNKEFKYFHNFVFFPQDKDGIFSVKKNVVACNLYRETLIYDLGLEHFKPFLEERKISIVDLKEQQDKATQFRYSIPVRVENLQKNIDFIASTSLFKTFNIQYRRFEKVEQYHDYCLKFLICKVYDDCENQGRRELTAIESNVLEIIKPENLDKVVRNVVKTYNKRSIDKYGKEESFKYRQEFKEHSVHIVAQILIGFLNTKIHYQSQWTANRNYNILTKLGVLELKLIAETILLQVTEVDIRSCFPRVLYALNGLALPDDFYGENKVNKIAVNKALNNFFYRPENKKYELKYQIRNKRAYLEMLNINPIVIDFMFEHFFMNEDRGSLFNFLSFHEKKIISQVKDALDEMENLGVVRRHDSVIIFGLNHYLDFLNEFEYLGQKGWFKIKTNEPLFPDFSYPTYENDDIF